MRSLIKFLVLALIIVFIGLWIMTVSKSCKQNDLGTLPDVEAGVNDKVTEVTDDIEDLFDENEEDGAFNEEGDELLSSDTEGGIDEDEMLDEDEMEDDTDLEEASTDVARRPSSNMEYLVISGAFLTEANAINEMKKLKKSGYQDAEVIVFDFSQYHSVSAQRTNSLSDARNLKNRLVSAGFNEAYVHKKRSTKKK